MSRTKDRDKFDRAIAWCRREYARRIYDYHAHCSHLAAEIMAEAEKRFKLGTFGVEGFAVNMDRGVQYLNTWDSYGRTVIFRAKSRNTGRWSLGAWGDIAERMTT